MTRLARTLALSVCVLSLLLGSARLAMAQSAVGIGAVTGGVSAGYKANSEIEKNVNKTLEAVLKSSDEGIPSLNSLVDDTSLSWQTSLYLTVAGVPADSQVLQGLNEEQKRILSERYGGGVIGQLGNGIVALYNPPASSQTYLADILESAHIIPQAQAQGLGFASLDPILETWKIFRNVAYLFFVIIFLVIGFMIMFRQKIGGQTVVTAQQAIPGIIIALIFVTFSYAIAGFLIDLMYLLMYLMVGLFRPDGGTELLSSSVFQVGWDLIVGVNGAFATVNQAVQGLVSSIDLTNNAIGAALGWIAGITLGLVISIAVLIGVFKIFFELLKTYIAIIIAITTAPLTLMFGALPGQANVGKWIKSIVGNLLAFPVVLMALIFYRMFTDHDLSAGGFIPPYLLGRGQGSVILTLVGIGIILVIPELIKEVKKLLGAEGGIFDALVGAAGKNAQAGWTGEGLHGWGAKRLLTPAALGAATLGSGGVGALVGGTISAARGGSFMTGAKEGGQFGLTVPAIYASGLGGQVISTIKGAVGKDLSSKTWGKLANVIQVSEATKQRLADTIAGEDLKEAGKTAPKKPATRETGDASSSRF